MWGRPRQQLKESVHVSVYVGGGRGGVSVRRGECVGGTLHDQRASELHTNR